MQSIHIVIHSPCHPYTMSSFSNVIHSPWCSMPSIYHVIHSPCHPVTLSSIHYVIHSLCHPFTMSSIHYVIHSPCQPFTNSSINMSSGHHAIIQQCHPFIILASHYGINLLYQSPSHSFTMSSIHPVISSIFGVLAFFWSCKSCANLLNLERKFLSSQKYCYYTFYFTTPFTLSDLNKVYNKNNI